MIGDHQPPTKLFKEQKALRQQQPAAANQVLLLLDRLSGGKLEVVINKVGQGGRPGQGGGRQARAGRQAR